MCLKSDCFKYYSLAIFCEIVFLVFPIPTFKGISELVYRKYYQSIKYKHLRSYISPTTTTTTHHRWELPVLRYHKIMIIYLTLFYGNSPIFSGIIFINYCMCILTGSPG